MSNSDVPAKRPRRKMGKRYVLEDQVGFILRQVSQRHATIFGGRINNELTPTQFSAMVKLLGEGPLSQNLLGRLTAMDAATIKGVIDRLSARGYVDARPAPEDGRMRLIDLTELGRVVAERAVPIATAITEETLAPLDDDERKSLLGLLKRLC